MLKPTATIKPFSSYIVPVACDYEVLYISIPDIMVGVDKMAASEQRSDAVWFNLNGQRVSKPSHGLYVRGGKTILVR